MHPWERHPREFISAGAETLRLISSFRAARLSLDPSTIGAACCGAAALQGALKGEG